MAELPRASVKLGKDGRPVAVSVPTVEQVQSAKPSDPDAVAALSEYLFRYGWLDPVEVQRQQVQYLSRFGITPDSADYEAQLARLADESMASRVVVATSRRVAQQAELATATGGKLEQWCVYVNEGDEPCPACLDLGGEDHPYSWFVDNHALPGDRCYGGDNCRCILVPYDRR